MELIVAAIVFGALLAIALYGLAVSNRQARLNNASRHAGAPTVHPHDQRIGREPAPNRTPDRLRDSI